MALYEKPSQLDLIWASEGEIVEPDDAGTFSGTSGTYSVQTGWQQVKPPYQVENWIQNQQSQFAAYINQRGVVGWDEDTEYQANLSLVMGSNGVIYKCISTHSGRNPVVGNPSYWEVFEGNRQATTSARGTVEFATAEEARDGTLGKAISASILQATKATSDDFGLGIYASQSDVNAGTRDDLMVSPSTLAGRTATEARSGGIRIANTAETNSGINDEKAITPSKLRLGVSMSLGTNGYITLPSWLGGVIFQWGQFDTGSVLNEATGSATFPATFPTSCYQVIVGAVAGNIDGDTTEGFAVTSTSTSGFNWTSFYRSRDNTFGAVRYFAIGK